MQLTTIVIQFIIEVIKGKNCVKYRRLARFVNAIAPSLSSYSDFYLLALRTSRELTPPRERGHATPTRLLPAASH